MFSLILMLASTTEAAALPEGFRPSIATLPDSLRPPKAPLPDNLRPPRIPSFTHMSLLPAGATVDTEVAPAIGTGGEFFAVSLLAGRTAVDVFSINYHLIGGTKQCDAGLEHRVQIRKESPLDGVVSEWQPYLIPEAEDMDDRRVSLSLRESIHLQPGERLAVAVQLVRDGDTSMCLAASSTNPFSEGHQFIAMSRTISYGWMSFEEAGIEGTLAIGATARLRPPR
jgi:hypothetical protein